MAATERRQVTHSYEADGDDSRDGARLALVTTGAGSSAPAAEDVSRARARRGRQGSDRSCRPTILSRPRREAGAASGAPARSCACSARWRSTSSSTTTTSARPSTRASPPANSKRRAGAAASSYFKAWARDLFLHRGLDKLTRLVRLFVYRRRGGERVERARSSNGRASGSRRISSASGRPSSRSGRRSARAPTSCRWPTSRSWRSCKTRCPPSRTRKPSRASSPNSGAA